MKKIGLIDNYLDNWHANNLPGWLKNEAAVSSGKQEYKICYAWGLTDPDGTKTEGEASKPSAVWCAEHDIELCSSAKEVVEKSDVLMVLSPNDPQCHPVLCADALASGKRTYVDKTFASDIKTAAQLIKMAKDGNTPMFSSSALRFSTELSGFQQGSIKTLSVRGPGEYQIYSIHQIEMIVALMGSKPCRIMAIGTESSPALVIEYPDKAFATMGHFGWGCPFSLAMTFSSGEQRFISQCSDYFPNFVHQLVDFFETGDVKAPPEETLAVIGIREVGMAALKTPGVWFDCKF